MVIFQIATMCVMFGLTFTIYKALGPPKRGLLYTRDEKTKWDEFISEHSLGGVLTTVNVVGTLTSLAGAYVFLMGNSKLFGYFILVCSVTLIPGAWITNKFSERIMASPRLKGLLNSPNQTGGVIAALFWQDDTSSRRTAILVKWCSIFYLCAILWLEFTFFAEIGAHLFGRGDSAFVASSLLFSCCFLVALFTLTYGVRGFVFADLFHVPLVLLATITILGGCILLSYQNWKAFPPIGEIVSPALTISSCILFALANLILNGLQILTTEAHWLRYWVFRDQERRKLTKSTVYTGALWALLSAAGLLAYYLSGNNVGVAAISGLLGRLDNLSVLFSMVFWIGGIAALFSTADATLYAFLVAWNFDSKTGVLHDRRMASIRPVSTALMMSVIITAIYLLAHAAGISIDKLVYVVYYIPLNLFPAFVRAYRGLPQSPWYVLGSLFVFLVVEIAGLGQPDRNLEWTLAATLVPISAGLIAVKGKKADKPAERAPSLGAQP